MERYNEYKDSGIQWIGKIPSHWKVLPIKRVAFLQSGDGIKPDDFTDEGYPVYGGNGFRGFTSKFTNEGEYALIGRQGALCGNINYASGKFFATEHAIVVYPLHNEPTVWLGEVLRTANLNRLSMTAAQPGLAVSAINKESIPVPPIIEQKFIVKYLIVKTSTIDTFIKNVDREISLLEEAKQKIIADAVTKGLDKNVEMKDSGIPWIGRIPAHWNVSKLKVLCRENKEKNEDNKESTVLSLSYGNVIVKKDLNFGLLPENFDSYQIVNPGYIIMRLTDLQNDHKSLRTGLVKNRGIITNAYVGLIVEKMNSPYLRFLLHSFDIKKLFYSMGGGLRQSMGYKDVANLFVCIPPKEEQEQIVSYIEERTSKIDSLISDLKLQIENLKEYKQKLISDVVTGQIKVC